MSTKKTKDNIIQPKEFIKNFEAIKNFDILSKYITNLSQFSNKRIVIKCGNSVLENQEAMYSIATNIAILQHSGADIILVHGGGNKTSEMLKIFGNTERYLDEERIVDESHFYVLEMVLKGYIAPHIVNDINHAGGSAISISGRDDSFIKVDKIRRIKKDPGSEIERIVELGLVGNPVSINLDLLEMIFENKIVPIITPIGIDKMGKAYFINADILAGFIAEQLNADLLLFLADFNEIINKDDNEPIKEISSSQLKSMLNKDKIPSKMKIKCESCISALKENVEKCIIINGNEKHSILLKLLDNNDNGTTILNDT